MANSNNLFDDFEKGLKGTFKKSQPKTRPDGPQLRDRCGIALWRWRTEMGLGAVVFLPLWYWLAVQRTATAALYAVLVLVVSVQFRQRLGTWLDSARVRRRWSHAVIHAGLSNPPPRRHLQGHSFLGPRMTRVRRVPVGYHCSVKVGVGRGTMEELQARSYALAACLSKRRHPVREVRVLRAPNGDASRADVIIVERDPFDQKAPMPWPNRDSEQISLWNPIPVGIDEEGQTCMMNLVERNILIGGEPGAGKSQALGILAASAALDPNTHLWILDAKEVELAVWAPCAQKSVGANSADAIEMLRVLQTVMESRYQELLARGQRKITEDLPLHVVLCDELAFYLQNPIQQERQLFVELLRDLVARGRAAGIVVCVATQKPSVDIVPSSLRDLFGFRLALRCNTPQASDTVLGQGWAHSGRDAATIPAGQRGVGFLKAEEDWPEKMKGFFLSDDDIREIASRAASNRMDMELDAITAGTSTSAVSSGESATDLAPATTAVLEREEDRTLEALYARVPAYPEALTADEIEAKIKVPRLRSRLNELVETGRIVKTGEGKRGKPFRYSRPPVGQ